MNPIMYTQIPVPQVKKSEVQNNPKAEASSSKKAFDECVDFTKVSAALTVSPKCSLLLQGIEMLSHPVGGGRLSGFDQVVGGLMIMASPVWGLFRVGVGVPCMIGGSIATVAVGGVHAVGALKRAVHPSEKSKLSEELTKKFVQRMQDILKDYSYNQQVFLKDNPKELVAFAAICVAFLSRKVEGKALKVGDKFLRQEDIEKLDVTRKGYFKDICQLKEAIQSLQMSPDNDHAWKTFMLSLENIEEEGKNCQDYNQRNRVETTLILLAQADELSTKVLEDSCFNRLWEASNA